MYLATPTRPIYRWLHVHRNPIITFILLFILGALLLTVIEKYKDISSSNKPESKTELIEWINNEAFKIQQDDPTLIKFVRENHIFPANKLRYNLASGNRNPSSGQLQSVLKLLRQDPGGFFVEAGANDGEWGSNTLYLEKILGWNGLLVEASPATFKRLGTKNRKAWHSNAALSTKPYPMLATFYENPNPSLSIWGGLTYRFYHKNSQEVKVQCVPLYTLLLAINQTVVDFLSLDLEGSELDVLRTIPFDKITIKAIAVEVINGKEGPEPVKELMRNNGYELYEVVTGLEDLIFINAELAKKAGS